MEPAVGAVMGRCTESGLEELAIALRARDVLLPQARDIEVEAHNRKPPYRVRREVDQNFVAKEEGPS